MTETIQATVNLAPILIVLVCAAAFAFLAWWAIIFLGIVVAPFKVLYAKLRGRPPNSEDEEYTAYVLIGLIIAAVALAFYFKLVSIS